MRPDPIEMSWVLEPLDRRHEYFIDGRQIIGLAAREYRGDVDAVEKHLHVRDGLGRRMFRRWLGVWVEAVGQTLDLAGVEHAVGFLEAEDAGFLGAIIAFAAVVLTVGVFPALAVIDDDRGFSPLRTFASNALACGNVIQKGELWPAITVRMVSRKLLTPW